MKDEALLCFICARNLEKVVSCWMETRKGEDGPEALQVCKLVIVFCCYNFPKLQCGKFFKCELLVFQVHEAGKQGVEKPESLEAKPRGLSGFETPCFLAK